MKKIVGFVLILAVLGGGAWYFRDTILEKLNHKDPELVLYGNVDNRHVDLAFLISERIAELYPEEGTFVKKGEVLGKLETVRIENEVTAAKAKISACKAAVSASEAFYEKMKNGSRAEDIAIARAGNQAISAKIKAAESNYQRQTTLRKTDSVSAQVQETAESEFLFLRAGLNAVQNYLNKLLAGERKEDIAAAAAKLEQAKAELAYAEVQLKILQQRLKDCVLTAPSDGIIRSRLLEPGELTNPQKPVLSLAITSPKWLRVYLPETLLTKVRQGDKAKIHFDGSDKVFEGWVGYISPNAEFTPKNIETAELRTNLVYEARIYVNDSENVLKLGAPATAVFPRVMVK